MSIVNTITSNYNDGGVNVGPYTDTITQAVVADLDVSQAGAATNTQYVFAFTKAKLKGIIIVSDQICVLKTNSTGSPGETITTVANIPIIWSASQSFIPNPFAGDVTTLYVTTTVTTALKIRTISSP